MRINSMLTTFNSMVSQHNMFTANNFQLYNHAYQQHADNFQLYGYQPLCMCLLYIVFLSDNWLWAKDSLLLWVNGPVDHVLSSHVASETPQRQEDDWAGTIVGWLCWGLTSQSTIFQSCRDGAIASWVINQYFRGVKCLAQGHNTAAVGFEPRTSRSGVRHSTTEPPRSPCRKNRTREKLKQRIHTAPAARTGGPCTTIIQQAPQHFSFCMVYEQYVYCILKT